MASWHTHIYKYIYTSLGLNESNKTCTAPGQKGFLQHNNGSRFHNSPSSHSATVERKRWNGDILVWMSLSLKSGHGWVITWITSHIWHGPVICRVLVYPQLYSYTGRGSGHMLQQYGPIFLCFYDCSLFYAAPWHYWSANKAIHKHNVTSSKHHLQVQPIQ